MRSSPSSPACGWTPPIVPLAHAFAADASARLGRQAPRLTDAAVAALRAHPWPGNARELRNVIERALLVVAGEVIDAPDLWLGGGAVVSPPAPPPPEPDPPAFSTSGPPPASLDDEIAALERRRIVEALERCSGNQSRAAQLLGMPRRTLVARLARYGIPRPHDA